MSYKIGISDNLPEDNNDNLLVSVQEALLPIFIWRNVTVNRKKEEKLSLLKRFILETAIEMETFRLADIETITSIPFHIVQRIVFFLKGIHLLESVSYDHYIPVKDNVPKALKNEAYPVIYPGRLSFVYLPQTGDLLAFDEADRGRRVSAMMRMNNIFSFFVSPDIRSRNIYAFLNERVKEHHVANLPDNVVDVPVPSEDHKIQDRCPAYHCNGKIIKTGDKLQLKVNLFDKEMKMNRKEPFEIDLTGANKLISKWINMADQIKEKQCQKQLSRAIGLDDGTPKINRDSVVLNIMLDKEHAEAIASTRRSLIEPFGINIEINEEVIFNFGAYFKQGDAHDPDINCIFLIDEVIKRMLRINYDKISLQKLKNLIIEMANEWNMAERDIDKFIKNARERLWILRQYHYIYSLREHEDFVYD